MALIAHQTRGSYASFRSRPVSWTKEMKAMSSVALQLGGRLGRSNLNNHHLSLSMRSSPIFQPTVKHLKISAFKGNTQNDESGGRSNGYKAHKNSVKLSYIPHEDEEIITESRNSQEAPVSYSSGEETIPGSPAIQKLFKKWLMMLRTQSSNQASDAIFGDVPPHKEIAESEMGIRKQEKGKVLMAAWCYFLGLDVMIKITLVIFLPGYLVVNMMYGAEVSKELTPLWVLGPLFVALYIKMLRGLCALYVFSLKQVIRVAKNLPTYYLLVYDYVSQGKLKEYLLARFWKPFVDIKSMDSKEVSRMKLKVWQEWASEKYRDYVELIWPYYCRTVRFLKKANLI